MLEGATVASHRPDGAIVVDAGVACFASRDLEAGPFADAEREALMADEPQRLGSPAWLTSFPAGLGDGSYGVFSAHSGGDSVVGVWLDFALVEIAEAKAAEPQLTDPELVALFDAFERAALTRDAIPDIRPLESGDLRPAHAKLFPRLAALLTADPLRDAVFGLAQRWLGFPEFHEAIASARLTPERWRLLHETHRFFRSGVEPVLAVAIARDESLPPEVRFALGDPAILWPIAAANLDAHALAFFCRRDVPRAAPSEEARREVEQALHSMGRHRALANLRRFTPPRLPG